MRKNRRRLAGIVLLGMVAAACGGGDDTSSPSPSQASDPSATSSESTIDATPSESTIDESGPKTGGRLVIGMDAETPGLDPIYSSNGRSGQTIGSAIYDTLTAVDASMNVVPFVAESVTPNEDATVWTIELRENLKFSDGTPLDAEAVKFTFDRLLEEGAPTASGGGFIKEVRVEGPTTVVIETNEPWAPLPATLAEGGLWFASPKAVTELGKDGISASPVGAGPFVLDEWVRDDHMTLVRNPNYFRPEYPYLDEVEFRPIPDDDARASALRAGDLDLIFTQSGPVIESFQNDPDYQVFLRQEGVDTIFLNTAKAPLNDVRVRKALALAIDKDRLIKVIWNGIGEPASSAFPATSPFFAEIGGFDFDLDEAKRLIAEYESETGTDVKLTLTVRNNTAHQELNQVVQSMWADAGVDATLGDPVDYATSIQTAAAGNFDVLIHLTPGFIDPDTWMRNLHFSSSPINIPNFEDADIDAALLTGRRSVALKDRVAAYVDLQNLLAQNVPVIYLRGNVNAVIAKANVRGIDTWTLPGGAAGFAENILHVFEAESLWIDN
ncbi:MAG TPA: ABC transporter substrate-binding protein [Ilumatobacteraceae bacterium]|nr:ABC transporter substrate-binding protein [Ilumatobacteraceae bacterium]